MPIKKTSLSQARRVPAPNRIITELFSSRTGNSDKVTLRIVDMLPASEQQPRHPHSHATFEETMFVLSGEGRLWAEGKIFEMKAGDALLVPPGIFHLVVNVSPELLRLACFFPVAEGVGVDQQEREEVTIGLQDVLPGDKA